METLQTIGALAAYRATLTLQLELMQNLETAQTDSNNTQLQLLTNASLNRQIERELLHDDLSAARQEQVDKYVERYNRYLAELLAHINLPYWRVHGIFQTQFRFVSHQPCISVRLLTPLLDFTGRVISYGYFIVDGVGPMGKRRWVLPGSNYERGPSAWRTPTQFPFQLVRRKYNLTKNHIFGGPYPANAVGWDSCANTSTNYYYAWRGAGMFSSDPFYLGGSSAYTRSRFTMCIQLRAWWDYRDLRCYYDWRQSMPAGDNALHPKNLMGLRYGHVHTLETFIMPCLGGKYYKNDPGFVESTDPVNDEDELLLL